MKSILVWVLNIVVLSSSHAQIYQTAAPIDSSSCSSPYRLWVDVGAYPLLTGSSTGTFVPSFNARAGLGTSLHEVQLYGFAELTTHHFEGANSMDEYQSSNHGYDLALYGMGTIDQFLYLGAGIYYRHQDNIVTHQFRNPDTTYNSGVRSYFHLYVLIGVGTQIHLSRSVSLPIGLYYQNQEFSDKVLWPQVFSLRLGVTYGL